MFSDICEREQLSAHSPQLSSRGRVLHEFRLISDPSGFRGFPIRRQSRCVFKCRCPYDLTTLSNLMSVILVVEDHPTLSRSVMKSLSEAGYETMAADTLARARQALSHSVDLVLLDLMLPDGDGLDWLSEVRAQGNRVPFLILTARDSIPDRVAGLDRGANDYLVKPFALDELLARIRALLRREAQQTPSVLSVGDLSADLITRTATRGGLLLELQNRQFELLVYLMQHANEVVSRPMISQDVWKEPNATWTNVIEVHINHLRKQLERSAGPAILHTIRGKGYLLGEMP